MHRSNTRPPMTSVTLPDQAYLQGLSTCEIAPPETRCVSGKASAYRRGSATGALGMQNSPINDLIEDLFEQAARGAPEFAE
jgi:hypothetical protein